MSCFYLKPLIFSVLYPKQHLSAVRILLFMDIPEQLPELSGKMRMHHLRPDPALREILLPHLAAGQHGPVRVKINSSLLFIVLEHLALHAVRQKVGPLQLADDPVIALQADLSPCPQPGPSYSGLSPPLSPGGSRYTLPG